MEIPRFMFTMTFWKKNYLKEMKTAIRQAATANGVMRVLLRQYDRWKWRQWNVHGHYHSPLPKIADVKRREKEIFHNPPTELPGINLNLTRQLALLEQLIPHYPEFPWRAQRQARLRYYLDNPWYAHTDAIILFCLLRQVQPKRIIEAGSGFSTAVILDTNDQFFQGNITCTCIDPHPERLRMLLKPGDEPRLTVLTRNLQDVDPKIFDQLTAGDMLVIDSSHVSKIGSDVNHIFFNILPRLRPGVWIHFHDIFYPFEYPREWMYEGRAWNEAYLLRAFLQYNAAFSIVFFIPLLMQRYPEKIRRSMPLCGNNPGGSIWIKKDL